MVTHMFKILWDVPGFASERQCPCFCSSEMFLPVAGHLQRFSMYKNSTRKGISVEVNMR